MFRNARLKLTAWYVLIILTVSIFFSGIIYRVLAQEVERFALMQRNRIERRIQDQLIISELPPPNLHQQIAIRDPDLVGETKHRILLTLFFINGSIAILAGVLGYILSGKTLKPIATMMEEQHRFISDASHELRTPLTALKSNLEVTIRNKHISLGDAKKTLKENLEDVENLERLTNKLLTLSQLEAYTRQTYFSPIHIEHVMHTAIHAVEPLAKKKHIEIHQEIAPIVIEAHAHELQDLCITLLDNAIKYSHEKSHITVTVVDSGKDAVITVTDHGIGIAEENLPHIFDRFFRADTARAKKHPDGYGLGLAIAKRIIDAHHGTIHVNSTLKKGTTFTVTVPKKPNNISNFR